MTPNITPKINTGANLAVIALILTASLTTPPRANAEDQTIPAVNVYSFRQPFLIEPLFFAFQKETGIHVNVLYAKNGLIERIALEGSASPADILLTTDITQMIQAATSIGQPVRSPTLAKNIPETYRDPQGKWFALTKRIRAVMASRRRVRKNETRRLTFQKLASPQWNKRICIRDGQNPYNLALFAAMLIHEGEENTRDFLTKLKDNLARRPTGNDRAQIRAVSAGECDIAIANSYYLGFMLNKPKKDEQRKSAESVRLVIPTFRKGGAHENLSAMIMPRYAPNPENALKLMEFLSTEKAQRIYSEANFEEPVHKNVPPPPFLRKVKRAKSDKIDFRNIARHANLVALILDEIAFNE